jgi:UDP-N-acetylmuramyl pentapeptide phosphotransferase/UDP-N-acetylglucosamine-1-phosphate transferase
MTGLVYAAGHAEWAAYLGVPRIPHAGEMTVLAAGMIGGVLGFLWFNCHPAQVFMGDTGSLPLGGLLGVLAIVARQELLLVVIAGVFVVEALSVMVQVGYYKWRRKRLLRCAPLHHHYQFLGWPENKIVVRFWIAAALCALVGMASLKIGAADAVPVAGGESANLFTARYVYKDSEYSLLQEGDREKLDNAAEEGREEKENKRGKERKTLTVASSR